MPSEESDETQKGVNYDLTEDALTFIEIDRDLINKAIRIKQAVTIVFIACCVSLLYHNNNNGGNDARTRPIGHDIVAWNLCLLGFTLFVFAATRLKPWQARHKLKWLPLLVLRWRTLEKPSRQQVERYVCEAARWRLEEIRTLERVALRRIACAVATGAVWSMVQTYESAGLDYFEEMARLAQEPHQG